MSETQTRERERKKKGSESDRGRKRETEEERERDLLLGWQELRIVLTLLTYIKEDGSIWSGVWLSLKA